MTDDLRCPQCNATNLSEAGSGLRHCAQCGATLAYRIHWAPLLGIAVAMSLVLGLGSALLLQGRAALLIGPVAVLTIVFMGRRFRRLQKV